MASNPRIDTYFVDRDRLRADGSRRADLDQEQRRSDADLPPLVPRRRLRLLRHEYRRHQHACLHQGDRRRDGAGENLSAAAQPVVKDLVPDLKNFYAQYASMEPWLQTTTPAPEKEWIAAAGNETSRYREELATVGGDVS